MLCFPGIIYDINNAVQNCINSVGNVISRMRRKFGRQGIEVVESHWETRNSLFQNNPNPENHVVVTIAEDLENTNHYENRDIVEQQPRLSMEPLNQF